jgi:hypothetical protein
LSSAWSSTRSAPPPSYAESATFSLPSSAAAPPGSDEPRASATAAFACSARLGGRQPAREPRLHLERARLVELRVEPVAGRGAHRLEQAVPPFPGTQDVRARAAAAAELADAEPARFQGLSRVFAFFQSHGGRTYARRVSE